MTQRKRAANLDLLRIVSMLLIILLHSIDHSGVLEQTEFSPGPIRFYVWFTYAMTQVCVNLYVMLSGYFLVNASFRIQKLVSLWLESVFYGFGLKLVFMLTGQEPFSAASLLSCFFPITTGRYWFLTIYVGLYLISPFLNHLVRTMDERQHACLNICLFVLFSLWSSIHPAIAGMNSGGGWGLTWFVVLYLLAAWLRLYYRPNNKPTLWIAVYFLIPFCMAVLKCLYGGGHNSVHCPSSSDKLVQIRFRTGVSDVCLPVCCFFEYSDSIFQSQPLDFGNSAFDLWCLSDSCAIRSVAMALGNAGPAGSNEYSGLCADSARLCAGYFSGVYRRGFSQI